MNRDHAFFAILRRDSVLCDAFLALLHDEVIHENSLDRIGEKSTVEYQRGKVAVLRHLEALAKQAAQKRGENRSE